MRPPTPLNTDATWQETGVAVAMQLARATQIELAEISRRLAAIVTGVDKLEARLTAEGALFEVKEQVHDGLFPSWTLSDGTLRILAILAALHVGQPPAVLCIEEPENSLHPTVIDCLMSEFEVAAARGTQVIITTHSPYLLNRVKAASSKAFWVDRPQGATRFSPLPGTAQLRKKMSQFGLGELLAQGALGKR
jgi:predicted ATPase